MANDQIPRELYDKGAKLRVIEWIRATSLPSRFRRGLLHDWGQAVGVDLAGADYEAVTEGGSHGAT